MKTQQLIALTLFASAAATAQGQDSAARFDAAREAYDAGHYRSAFDTFASLADQGHCDAMRIATQMSRWGRPLYAHTFEIGAERLRQWQALRTCLHAGPAGASAVAARR
jgi:hypothetical protein